MMSHYKLRNAVRVESESPLTLAGDSCGTDENPTYYTHLFRDVSY